jgi:Sulfotransferase domain
VAGRTGHPTGGRRRRTFGSQVDSRLRHALPRPAYEVALRGYKAARTLARRNPGRGHALPDFVIIGAAKAGTTSLFGWLAEHPYVCGSVKKELNYFSPFYYRGEDWYRKHFPLERDRRAFAAEHGRPFLTGEASPSYFLHVWAPERLAKVVPDAKLIVQLRDPVDRAYSHYQMRRRDGQEPLDSFEAALEAEEERITAERARMLRDKRYSSLDVALWSYLLTSRYVEHLERWLRHFPREQFHFVELAALRADPLGEFARVQDFLGLPAHVPEDFDPRFAFDYDPLPPDVRSRLDDYFEPYNQRLYELLGTDFGWGRARDDSAADRVGVD